MTTKQRAYLKSLAMTMDPIFQVGKSSMTPGLTEAISEALAARELIKITVLNNCADDPRELPSVRTRRSCRLSAKRSSSIVKEKTIRRRSCFRSDTGGDYNEDRHYGRDI